MVSGQLSFLDIPSGTEKMSRRQFPACISSLQFLAAVMVTVMKEVKSGEEKEGGEEEGNEKSDSPYNIGEGKLFVNMCNNNVKWKNMHTLFDLGSYFNVHVIYGVMLCV